jgi:hypothetical protein
MKTTKTKQQQHLLQCARCFVQQQQLRLLHQHASNRDALLLSSTQSHTSTTTHYFQHFFFVSFLSLSPLPHFGRVSLGQLVHELARGRLSRRKQVLARVLLHTKRHVELDGFVEKSG